MNYGDREKMVVMFLLPNLSGGGAERVITNIIRSLDRSRYIPILVLIVAGGSDLRARIPSDVQIVELGRRRMRHSMRGVMRQVRERRPHLVISTLDHLNIWIGLLRIFWPKETKLILRMTDLDSLNQPMFRFLLGFAARVADGIIFQSYEMMGAFQDALRLPKSSGVVISNPVDVAEIRNAALAPIVTGFSANRIELVAVGRLTPNKGFDLLLEALALIDNPRVHLTILGRGSEEKNLKARAFELGIAGRVDFVGFKENPYPFFAGAHAFILSSRFEGFPNVVLEALACGARVAATPVPGIHKLLTDVAGCVIAENMTPAAISAAILQVIENEGVPGPDAVKAYDTFSVVAQYETYFREVVGRAS